MSVKCSAKNVSDVQILPLQVEQMGFKDLIRKKSIEEGKFVDNKSKKRKIAHETCC